MIEGVAAGEPYGSTEASIAGGLRLLSQLTPIQTWMVTRHRAGECVVLHTSPSPTVNIASGQVFADDDGPCASVLASMRPMLATNAASMRSIEHFPAVGALGLAGYIGVPLVWRAADGAPLPFGTLAGLTTRPVSDFSDWHTRLALHMARAIGTSILESQRIDEMRRRAERAESENAVDELTRVHNRRGWHLIAHAEASRLQRYGSRAGIIMVDLDDLKRTNDTYGHRAGDALLRHTAHVLRATIRESDVVARLGGDEFAALLLESDEVATRTAAQRIEDCLEHAGIGASVGWSTLDGSREIDAALHEADAAMYASKCSRKQPSQANSPNAA